VSASWPRCSVAVVTHGRHPLLPLLLEQFDRQSYPARELVILDDSPQPATWLADLGRPDVVYRHLPARLSVGAKRNRILDDLGGELVCQWDDDDYYAPDYLATAARHLAEVDFVKLDRWYVYDLGRDDLSYWDTRQPLPGLPPAAAADWTARNQLGYGFSFAYRRTVLEQVRSPDTSVGDDYEFARRVRERGFTMRLLPDQQGLVLHLVHGGNLSRCFPNRRLVPAFLGALFPGFSLSRYQEALRQIASGPGPDHGGPLAPPGPPVVG